MSIGDIVTYFGLFFFYIIPWLLILLAFGWIKDWVVDIYVRARSKMDKTLNESKANRWVLILALMKIIMFIALLMPIFSVIEYLFDDSVADPASTIFNESMWYVFFIIVVWYFLAMIVIGIVKHNQEDMDKEELEDSKYG